MKAIAIIIILLVFYLIYDLIKSMSEHKKSMNTDEDLSYGDEIEYRDAGVKGKAIVIGQIRDLVRMRADSGKVLVMPRGQCTLIKPLQDNSELLEGNGEKLIESIGSIKPESC